MLSARQGSRKMSEVEAGMGGAEGTMTISEGGEFSDTGGAVAEQDTIKEMGETSNGPTKGRTPSMMLLNARRQGSRSVIVVQQTGPDGAGLV
jgi:hypothetical protein